MKTKIITGAIASLGLACASSAYALNLGDPVSNTSGIQLVRDGAGPDGGGGGNSGGGGGGKGGGGGGGGPAASSGGGGGGSGGGGGRGPAAVVKAAAGAQARVPVMQA